MQICSGPNDANGLKCCESNHPTHPPLFRFYTHFPEAFPSFAIADWQRTCAFPIVAIEKLKNWRKKKKKKFEKWQKNCRQLQHLAKCRLPIIYAPLQIYAHGDDQSKPIESNRIELNGMKWNEMKLNWIQCDPRSHQRATAKLSITAGLLANPTKCQINNANRP